MMIFLLAFVCFSLSTKFFSEDVSGNKDDRPPTVANCMIRIMRSKFTSGHRAKAILEKWWNQVRTYMGLTVPFAFSPKVRPKTLPTSISRTDPKERDKKMNSIPFLPRCSNWWRVRLVNRRRSQSCILINTAWSSFSVAPKDVMRTSWKGCQIKNGKTWAASVGSGKQ